MTADPVRSPRRRWISVAINVMLFGVAIVILGRVLADYRVADVLEAFKRIGVPLIAASIAIAALGYLALIAADYLSLRVAGAPMPIGRMWEPSFVSHAVANSAPMSIVAGGGMRYRLFGQLGVSGRRTGTMVATNLLTFVLGLFTVAGLAFVISPIHIPHRFHLPLHSLRPVGVVFLLLVVAMIVTSASGVTAFRIGRWRIRVPDSRMVRAQVAVSTADWLLSSGALYVLFTAAGPVPYLPFLTAFLLAQIVTQVVPVPGGIGVFEAAILLTRPHVVAAPLATAALVLYRVIYYLAPLATAGLLLLLHWRPDQRRRAARTRK